MRPLLDDEKYSKMEVLAKEFKEKTAPRLQKYLILKSWWTTNYVSTPSFSSAGVGGPPLRATHKDHRGGHAAVVPPYSSTRGVGPIPSPWSCS